MSILIRKNSNSKLGTKSELRYFNVDKINSETNIDPD